MGLINHKENSPTLKEQVMDLPRPNAIFSQKSYTGQHLHLPSHFAMCMPLYFLVNSSTT